MKIWQVWDEADYYGPYLRGAFSTEQKALEFLDLWDPVHRKYHLSVEEYELDSATVSEFYAKKAQT